MQNPLSFTLPSFTYTNYLNLKNHSIYIDHLDLKLLSITYNVAGKAPTSEDISTLVNSNNNSSEYDIILIGLQESIPLNIVSLLNINNTQQIQWKNLFHKHLSFDNYTCIKDYSMFGLYSLIFIHNRHINHIHDLSVAKVGTGMSGVIDSNKGGIGIRFQLYHTSFVFVNIHLSHAHNDILLRNSEYELILSQLSFHTIYSSNISEWEILNNSHIENEKIPSFCGKRWKTIWEADHIILSGDCNYHVNLSLADCLVAVETNNYDRLLKKDQLLDQRRQKLAFAEFAEMDIKFFPTYKFNPGSNDYDTKKGIASKVPSYCDRIFYVPSPLITPLTYTSLPDIKQSDHKPVHATFDVKIKFLLDDKLETLNSEMSFVYKKWLNHFKTSINKIDRNLIPRVEDFGNHDQSEVSKNIEIDYDAATETANAFSKLGSTLAFASGDEDYRRQRALDDRKTVVSDHKSTAQEHLITGLQKFGTGISDGVSGLFLKPIEYAKSDGAMGFVKGLGIGIGGFLAKPVAGVFDMSMHMAKAAATQNTSDSMLTLDAYCHSILISNIALNPIVTDCGSKGIELLRKRKKTINGGIFVIDDTVKNNDAVDNLSLEELIIQEHAALAEPMLLNLTLHDHAFSVSCTNFRLLIFCLPHCYSTRTDQSQDNVGIFTSLSTIKHNFGAGSLGALSSNISGSLKGGDKTPAATLAVPAIKSARQNSSKSITSAISDNSNTTTADSTFSDDKDDFNALATETEAIEDYRGIDSDFSLEIMLHIPPEYNIPMDSDLPKYCIRLSTVTANEKFLVLNCVQVDPQRLEFERAMEAYKIAKENFTKNSVLEENNKSVMSKIFGGKEKATFNLKLPKAPTKETRLSYRISCWDKQEALFAAKLLSAYRECLPDLTK